MNKLLPFHAFLSHIILLVLLVSCTPLKGLHNNIFKIKIIFSILTLISTMTIFVDKSSDDDATSVNPRLVRPVNVG